MKIISKKCSKTRSVSFSVFLFFLCFSLFLSSVSFADTITYQYDASNRLTGVEHSSGTTIEYSYDAAGNMLTKKVLLRTTCTECSTDPVVLQNVEFPAGTNCECIANTYITIGSGVRVKNGATVTFKAPKISVKSGARFERGAVVNIRQQ